MRDPFCHRLALDRVRSGDRLDLVAGDEERQAIADRLGLESLERLEANATMERDGPVVRARGRIRASLGQSCIVTGEPVASHVDEPFDLVFLPEPEPQGRDEEIELSSDECDTVFYESGTLDLGSAVADTLVLTINPYPRSLGAEAALKEAGVLSEEQAGPFAALAQLKKGGDNA